MLMTILFW